jgi:ribosome-associated translation inhibitor RaiA
MAIDLEVEDRVPESQRAAARRRFEALSRYADDPIDVHARLRSLHSGRGAQPYTVDAELRYRGRSFAAHVSGPAAAAAAEEAADRLRRQLRRVVGADVALRNEPRTLQRAIADLPFRDPAPATGKPPEEREIVRGHTYADHPQSTYEAISDLIDDDLYFHLFVHVRTGEDVVVHRRDFDERIGLLHPRESVLADEADDVVVPEPSRYSEPLTLARARAEMDLVEHRFLYFIDAEDRRGKVLYRRRDGDYGLVEPR